MTLIEIGLLESSYHSCNLIFEIPTGAMADLLGRKKMIILSRLAAMISSIVLLVSSLLLDLRLALFSQLLAEI